MESHADYLHKLEKNRKGSFLVENRGGRAYLRVDPPGESGARVRPRDVLARLELFGLEGYDPDEIEDIVLAQEGVAREICEWSEPDPEDARVRVDVSEDRMSATIEAERPRRGGAPLSEEMIREALRKAGVLYGVFEKSIRDLLLSARGETDASGGETASLPRGRVVRALIARGKPAEAGMNESIQFYFEPRPRPRPRPRVPGASELAPVDFRKLDVIQTCRAQSLLAQIVEGSAGEEGRNVLGEKLEPPVLERASLEAGANVRLGDDGRTLHSLIDGHVRAFYDPEKRRARIDVAEVLRLDEVNYSTGHVDFPGTVLVEGGALDGFRIRAEGDIIIKKSVGNVNLKARGDIILTGGIVSRGTGSIQAGGSVYARFVENAVVHARGSVYIEEAAMHARIAAGTDIVIEGGRGELIGGVVLCGGMLKARKFGARNETETVLTIGLSPDVMEELERLENEYLEKREILDKIRIRLDQMDQAARRGREPEPDQDETRAKLEIIRENYGEAIQNLEKQRTALYARIKPSPGACAEALEEVYPGVEINFGAGIRSYRVLNRPIRAYCRFVLEEGSLVLRHSDL